MLNVNRHEAKVVEAPGCQPEDRRFDSVHADHDLDRKIEQNRERSQYARTLATQVEVASRIYLS